MEEKPKKIYIIGPKSNELKNGLEMLIKVMTNYEFEEILELPAISKVPSLNPNETTLVIDCSADYSGEDLSFLKTNFRIPVIRVWPLAEKADEDKLIEQFNYFAAVPAPSVETSPTLAKRISDALEMKRSADKLLNLRRGELLLDANLQQSLEEEIKAVPPEYVNGEVPIFTSRQPLKKISTFEALYNKITQQRQTEIIRIDTDIHAKLISRVVPNLKLLEQKIASRQEGEPDALLYSQTARDELRPIIASLSDKSEWQRYQVVQYRLGGSTIAEKGSRFLIGATRRKKYTEREAENIYFLRDIYDRKGIDSETIAKIRYRCSKLPSESNGMGRCAALLPPICYENKSYWVVEQGILGQDLAVVMNGLRERINQNKGKEKTKYLKMRDALEDKYIRDLIAWQNTTRRIPTEFPEILPTADNIAEGYKHNLAMLAETYTGKKVLSEKALQLWKKGLDALNERNLGLTKRKIALSLDASSRNVKVHTLQNNASLDEILAEISSGDEPDEEKINSRFFHVDTGFVLAHYLEDFFHIIDAYEVANTGAPRAEVLLHLKRQYKKLCESTGVVEDETELYAVGTYRNLRRAYLIINEFTEKNAKDVIDGTISPVTFEKDRKSYLAQHQHHVSRAELYLSELHRHFDLRRKKYSRGAIQLTEEYKRAIALLDNEGLTDKTIDTHLELFSKLEQAIPAEDNRYKRRYLCSMLYSTMTHALSKLCDSLIDFSALPRYKDISAGESNAS